MENMSSKDIFIHILSQFYTIFLIFDVIMIILHAIALILSFEKINVACGIGLLIGTWIGFPFYLMATSNSSKKLMILQAFFYPCLLILHRWKKTCSRNHNAGVLGKLQKLRDIIETPIKLIVLLILMLSNRKLFIEDRFIFWYAEMTIYGWNGNIVLQMKFVALISCIFQLFVIIMYHMKPQLYDRDFFHGLIDHLHNVVGTCFQISSIVIAFTYIEVLSLPAILCASFIFIAITKHEDDFILKSLGLLFIPLKIEMKLYSEICRTVLYLANLYLCILMIDTKLFVNVFGGWLYNKWILLDNYQANVIIISLALIGMLNAIASLLYKYYEKFHETCYYKIFAIFTWTELIIIPAISVFFLNTHIYNNEIVMSYFQSPNNIISITAKGKYTSSIHAIFNIDGSNLNPVIYLIADATYNSANIPCFANLIVDFNGESDFPIPLNGTKTAIILDKHEHVSKYESKPHVNIIIMRSNETFLPSNTFKKIESSKIILSVTPEDWNYVSTYFRAPSPLGAL